MAKKTNFMKNFQSTAKSQNSLQPSLYFNDSLIVVGLAHCTVLPFFYSNKSSTDLEKAEKHAKTLSDLVSSVCEHARPYLVKVEGEENTIAVATNDGCLVTLTA